MKRLEVDRNDWDYYRKVRADTLLEPCERAIFLNATMPLPIPPVKPIGRPIQIVRKPPAMSPGSPRKALIRTRGINRQTRNMMLPITMATRRRN